MCAEYTSLSLSLSLSLEVAHQHASVEVDSDGRSGVSESSRAQYLDLLQNRIDEARIRRTAYVNDCLFHFMI